MAKPDPTDKLLDELIAGKKPEEFLGNDGILKQLTKRLTGQRDLELDVLEMIRRLCA